MDGDTHFETGVDSIGNRFAFSWKCNEDTVAGIGIRGRNEMDKGRQGFSLSVHSDGGRLWVKS